MLPFPFAGFSLSFRAYSDTSNCIGYITVDPSRVKIMLEFNPNVLGAIISAEPENDALSIWDPKSI